jgi:hypothetical protein
MEVHQMFKRKPEKIYKFVYNNGSGYRYENKTILLTACDPVQAVQKFNNMAGKTMYNVVEFIEVVHKTEEIKE